MAIRKHLIIGCGSAALSALERIRASSSEDEVKLVTMEEHPPYSPASLPYLMSGRITEAELWMKGDEYLKNLKATLATNKEVTQVLPAEKKVAYSDGTLEHYDTLLVATGSEPIEPSIKGLEEVEIQSLRTLSGCRRLLNKLAGKKNVVILGAGMVAMKIAAALLEKDYQVSLIEKEQRIMPLYFNEEAELYIKDIFIHKHADFFTGTKVTEVNIRDKKIGVRLSDGRFLDADVLINATGVRSRVCSLEGAGVKMNYGILVDSRMRTNIDDVYAAGDVAEGLDYFTGRPKMNATIPNAIDQGKVAGANMSGGDAVCEGGIPMMVLNFFTNQAVSVGLTSKEDEDGQVLKQKDDEARKFKKLIFSGQRLVGGMFVNERVDPGIILYLIRKRVDISTYKEALFEGTKPLCNPWLRSLRFSSVK